MRLFRRARDTKPTPVIRRAGVVDVVEVKSVVPQPASSGIAPVERAEADAAVSSPRVRRRGEDSEPNLPTINVPPSPPSYEGLDDSDVFVCENKSKSVTSREVTLFVHRWHNVEPGLLSWTFPSLRAALDAVQRMKNAIGWCVVSGTTWTDLESARANGAVLVEQLT